MASRYGGGSNVRPLSELVAATVTVLHEEQENDENYTSKSGPSNVVMKAPSISESETFLTPLKERIPPCFDTQPGEHTIADSTALHEKMPSKSDLYIDKYRDELGGSTSDVTSGLVTQVGPATSVSTQTAFRMGFQRSDGSEDEPKTRSETLSLHLPRPLGSTSSNPGIAVPNSYRDPSVDSATLQQTLREKVTLIGDATPRPERLSDAQSTSGSFQEADLQDTPPGLMWFPGCSNSRTVPASPTKEIHCRNRQKAPLKSSMKHSSKSAGASTPEAVLDSSSSTDSQSERHSLRRVKSVEFKETYPVNTETFPSPKPWSSGPVDDQLREGGSKSPANNSKAIIRRAPSYPGPMSKSTAADPALTKTDVHVVAIAPSWGISAREGGVNTATPTMQIVESQGSRYEVVWDDVPTEGSVRARRRNSVASLALQTVGSSTAKGLERVNSKLSEWNWGRGPDLESVAPQIVVFPDDEGGARSTLPLIDSGANFTVRVPPNSQKTSAAPSCLPSTPGTAWPSNPGTPDSTEPAKGFEFEQSNDRDEDCLTALTVPDPEASLKSSTALESTLKNPPTDRRLSNIEDSEIKFRGHRDSVTIARSRLLHNREITPELVELRGSNPIAKKRMHARNYAKSEDDIARAKVAKWEPLVSLDPAIMTSPLPTPPTGPTTPSLTVRSDGWGFRSGSPSSIPRQASPNKGRHIVLED
ncbi:hypothetical protein BU23DRAFT_564242 [Bimuria novae-zelandiae CBS 107.79]|uniref:Uncharacterized protein n=1 Tax=Bimuria novae-zelandiae CBS 107.79 TaxID=1447943 RepID=A0A6A5VP31_9PLEO|nr:hypothetical protein BU23DRAFT_564242 [Bimuria novae-zelandiae CBS 107.79]